MVDVYALDIEPLAKAEIFDFYYDKLSLFRREKVDRAVLQKTKCLSLGAGILIDAGLCEYGLSEKNAEYVLGPDGKPYFSNGKYKKIFFSVSHSEKKVICAFSEAPVGADIEFTGKNRKKIADRFFCRSECEYIQKGGDDRFYRAWTAKESYIKLFGKGMYFLSDFELDFKSKISVKSGREAFFAEYFFEKEQETLYKICACSEINEFCREINIIKTENK